MAGNQGAPVNRRPAAQSCGSGGFGRDCCSCRSFPAAVAELGRYARRCMPPRPKGSRGHTG